MSTTEIIVALVVAILGSSGLATLIQILVTRHYAKRDKQSEDTEAIRKAVEALAHDAYYRHTRQLLTKSVVTEEELENHNYLYNAYHNLGLNSTGDQMHEQVMQKQVVPYGSVENLYVKLP